ncbi:MAG: AbrB/MazE/SpoVT family DNA-binding domain-containing protein [Candidatus Bathyarchaeia archaeon]
MLQKGKVTIPVSVRERLGITEGDYLTFEVVGNKIILLPPRTASNPTEALSGLVKGISVEEPIGQELRKTAALKGRRGLPKV